MGTAPYPSVFSTLQNSLNISSNAHDVHASLSHSLLLCPSLRYQVFMKGLCRSDWITTLMKHVLPILYRPRRPIARHGTNDEFRDIMPAGSEKDSAWVRLRE
jgi:hypothetical protein